ncbi:MAG TPA: hypothetical protein VFR84_02910 [Candidatus Angelobacter sp.]|nr:hypothetical protein [Candidatus Angelobacter sp.]
MADIVERRRNSAPWLAFLFTLVAIILNGLTFLTLRGTQVVLWLSFLAGLIAAVYGIVGIGRAFGRSRVFSGKVSSLIFGVLALLVCGLMVFIWYHARALPASAGAPQVGQKVPDFTLPDTQGRNVSLTQLLGHADPGGAAPKAVLLIFYRGYW